MTTKEISTRLASIIAPEIDRILREQSNTIADLEERLCAANERAQAAESRLEQLRQVLNPPPIIVPVVVPEPPTLTARQLRDVEIADFHRRRSDGFVGISELALALNTTKVNAQWHYREWCRRNNTTRINYNAAGQRITYDFPL